MECKSETQIPQYHRLNIQDDEIYIVDTPGLEDTQGFIYDIANSLILTDAIFQAASVRIVILMGFKLLNQVEGRANAVKDVIDMFSKLIKDF